VSLEEAQNMVMTARVKLGWVTIEELEAQAAAEAEAAAAKPKRPGPRAEAPGPSGASRMTRGGRKKEREDGPERRCIVTGETAPKRGLVRFVVSPDGEIAPDILEKLPGRGIWVSAERDAIETAVKKNLFAARPRRR
jgi:predicted RNA-binding protein YlxR (DUF448 family)